MAFVYPFAVGAAGGALVGGGLFGKYLWDRMNNSRIGYEYRNPESPWGSMYPGSDSGSAPAGFYTLHNTNDRQWWRKVFADIGVNPYTPFGSYYMESAPAAETLWGLYTPLGTGSSLQSKAGFGQDYVRWLKGGGQGNFRADYTTIGEALSSAFAGNDSAFSKQLQDAADNPEEQMRLIANVIMAYGAGTMDPRHTQLIINELEYMLDQYYNDPRAFDGLTFVQYLVENASQFLDKYWKGMNWKAAPPRQSDGWVTTSSAASGGGGAGGTVTEKASWHQTMADVANKLDPAAFGLRTLWEGRTGGALRALLSPY